MRPQDPVDVAVRFIESINRRDFDHLHELMDHDHQMIDHGGGVHEGRGVAIDMIREYTERWPGFQIHISDIYLTDHVVVIVGRTTGSCADKTPGEEIRERLIYVIRIEGGFAASFRYALPDTESMRKELGVHDANRITR
jgi:hypothetical protein